MNTRNYNIAMIFLFCFSLLNLDYYLLSIIAFLLAIYQILYKIGKGIIMMELIIFISILIYLVIPILGYEVYTKKSEIATLWAKVMPIPKEQYYQYFLPCIISFALGLKWYFGNGDNIDEGINVKKIVNNIKKVLSNDKNTGVVLSYLGISSFFINNFLGSPFGYFGTLMFYTLFPGIMYLYFTPKSRKKYFFITLNTSFIIYNALSSGMFTIVAYMGATLFSLILIGKEIAMFKKLILFIVAIIFIIAIQAIKGLVRNSASSTNQFLLSKNAKATDIFTENGFFPMYVRTNQGFLTAGVLKRIPEKQDFDGGKSIFLSIASIFVPRFFWPDKPESGGIYNMKHFLNFKLKGYSMNIGPPGEAYGNFGKYGGIIFMFVFGLMIRFFYRTTIKLSFENPLLILWLPITFFQVLYCMENDVLQALNSVLKGSIFVFVLSKAMPSLFNIKEKD